MKNMSFSITKAQMYAGTKTVTRRLGWASLKAGEIIMAIEKGQGLKRGEKVKRIYPIRIISVRAEFLSRDITIEEVRKEGFDKMSVPEFVHMFCKANKCDHDVIVNRIEFEKVTT